MKTPVVCNLTGASFRQIDLWARKGYVTPSIVATRGTGHRREWSTEDAVRVAVMVELVSAGMDPAAAALSLVHPEQVGSFRRSGPVLIFVNVEKIRNALTDRRDLAA